MKPSQIVFNIVALLIAGFCVFGLLSTAFIVMPATPIDRRGIWYLMICLYSILILMLGGGGVANFAKGRLAAWPTGVIVGGYCLSVWLLPLAIWGVLAMLAERKRSQGQITNAEQVVPPNA
jgi:hypothetical protein